METPTPKTPLEEYRNIINEWVHANEAKFTKVTNTSSRDLLNNIITQEHREKIIDDMVEDTFANRSKGADMEALIFLNREKIQIGEREFTIRTIGDILEAMHYLLTSGNRDSADGQKLVQGMLVIQSSMSEVLPSQGSEKLQLEIVSKLKDMGASYVGHIFNGVLRSFKSTSKFESVRDTVGNARHRKHFRKAQTED